MKRWIYLFLALWLLTSFSVCHYTRYNLDNVPSLETVERLGEEWSNERLTGFPRDMLVYIWDEPDLVSDGAESWYLSEEKMITLTYGSTKAQRVEMVVWSRIPEK